MSSISLALKVLPGALLSVGLLTAAVAGTAAPLALDPEKACEVLADEGLGARGGYRAIGDTYRCASARKPLAAGGSAVHEIRFYGDGTRTSVARLGLSLYIRSRQDIQRAHATLARTATTVTERLLDAALPGAVVDTVLSGTSGNWVTGDRQYDLRRNTAGNGLYELHLTIE